MLDQRHFDKLPFYEKIKKVYFEGEFVLSIRYYKFKINLFIYNNFYVEVFYNPKADKIDKIEIFKLPPSRVKFYADQIKLPSDLL